jgi:hypothetical protein
MALGIVNCSPTGGRTLIVRRVGVIILLGVSALLSECFPASIQRNEPPGIGSYVPVAGRAQNLEVLVLAITEEYRASGLGRAGRAVSGNAFYEQHREQ